MKKFICKNTAIFYFTLCTIFTFNILGCSEKEISYSVNDVKLEKYNWRGEIPQSNKVRLINNYGNISTRNTNQKNIELAGVVQKVGVNAPTPDFIVRENNGITEIEVFFSSSTTDNFGNRIARVDLGIYVPKSTSLELITDFGDIKAKKHQSKIVAISQTGKIKLSTENSAMAKSNKGDINLYIKPWQQARFQSENKKLRYELYSHEGGVNAYFSETASLAVSANSGKGISFNEPLFFTRSNSKGYLFDELNFQSEFNNGERILSIAAPLGQIKLAVSKRDIANFSSAEVIDIDVNSLASNQSWQPGDAIIDSNNRSLSKD